MSDPRPPRDRTETPIEGSGTRATAAGEFEVEDTGVHDVIKASGLEPDEGAAIDDASARRMQRRVKETNVVVAEANSGVQTLRRETKAHVDRIDAKVAVVEVKVDTISDHVLDLVGATGRMEGQLGELVKTVDDQRGRQHVTFSAQVDVDREASVAEIKDGADVKAKRRELRYKVAIALVGGVSLASILERLGIL